MLLEKKDGDSNGDFHWLALRSPQKRDKLVTRCRTLNMVASVSCGALQPINNKMAEMHNREIKEKVLKYEAFVNDVLKEDLKGTHSHLDRINSELAEWIQLKTVLNTLMDNNLVNGFKTKMDIGTNIYAQAEVTDSSTVLINIGCSIYVQYNINEALRFIEKQISLLQKQVDIVRNRGAEIKARIKLVLHGIQELSNLK